MTAHLKLCLLLHWKSSFLYYYKGVFVTAGNWTFAKSSLPLLAKHRINCIRTAIKRNIAVQNYAYSKQMLELLLSKAPPSKQEEFRSLIHLCVQRGLTNKSIDPLEDPSQFCAATLSRLSAIGYDVSDLCGSKFSAVTAPGCIICGMGSIKRSDAVTGPVPSPFGWVTQIIFACTVCSLAMLLYRDTQLHRREGYIQLGKILTSLGKL